MMGDALWCLTGCHSFISFGESGFLFWNYQFNMATSMPPDNFYETYIKIWFFSTTIYLGFIQVYTNMKQSYIATQAFNRLAKL